MSYFPLLSAPGCEGWVGLCNFPPNNWEHRPIKPQFVNLTWSTNRVWNTRNLGKLNSGEFRTVTTKEVADIVPKNTLALISLTQELLPETSNVLPKLCSVHTSFPAWRASLGLSSSSAQTSYQGELDAFPPKGSLMTFGPFLQFGEGITNHLILLNLENSPKSRMTELELYDAGTLSKKGQFIIKNNASNCVHLDELGFTHEELPLIICREMSAIPLYFSSAMGGAYLSLEHTHPPASLVVQGSRWEAQKLLKKRWFEKSKK
jgi:hypothetical protein